MQLLTTKRRWRERNAEIMHVPTWRGGLEDAKGLETGLKMGAENKRSRSSGWVGGGSSSSAVVSVIVP